MTIASKGLWIGFCIQAWKPDVISYQMYMQACPFVNCNVSVRNNKGCSNPADDTQNIRTNIDTGLATILTVGHHGWITSTWYPVSPYYQSSGTVYKVGDSRPFTRENVSFSFPFWNHPFVGAVFFFSLEWSVDKDSWPGCLWKLVVWRLKKFTLRADNMNI